jgi:CRISPR-associated protein Cas1
MLASADVLVRFCGRGGTPLFSYSEIEWLNLQNEYRASEYVQDWVSFWFDDSKRLAVGKNFQHARVAFIQKTMTLV